MLDMGFEQDVRKIVEMSGMPDKSQRQTLMYSATFPDEIQRLAADFLKEQYLFVVVGKIGGSNLDISQAVISVPGDDKQEKLFDILLNSGAYFTEIQLRVLTVSGLCSSSAQVPETTNCCLWATEFLPKFYSWTPFGLSMITLRAQSCICHNTVCKQNSTF